jgi:small subunit ribosomal protein S14
MTRGNPLAKKSKVVKEKQRQEMVLKYAKLRRELKEQGDYDALRKLPRDSSPTRLKSRCELTGRPRGIPWEIQDVPHCVP